MLKMAYSVDACPIFRCELLTFADIDVYMCFCLQSYKASYSSLFELTENERTKQFHNIIYWFAVCCLIFYVSYSLFYVSCFVFHVFCMVLYLLCFMFSVWWVLFSVLYDYFSLLISYIFCLLSLVCCFGFDD